MVRGGRGFHPQVYCGPLFRRLVAQTVTAIEVSTNEPTMAIFSA